MGSMLTMTHSTSQTGSPQDSPSLPDQVRQTPHLDNGNVQTPVSVLNQLTPAASECLEFCICRTCWESPTGLTP